MSKHLCGALWLSYNWTISKLCNSFNHVNYLVIFLLKSIEKYHFQWREQSLPPTVHNIASPCCHNMLAVSGFVSLSKLQEICMNFSVPWSNGSTCLTCYQLTNYLNQWNFRKYIWIEVCKQNCMKQSSYQLSKFPSELEFRLFLRKFLNS